MADTPTPPAPEPTPEEMAKMQKVAQAGAQAGAEAQTPEQATEDARKAMRSEADQVGLEISDAQIDAIADTFVAKVVAQFEQRGAFDAPPEPVQAPAQPHAPPPPAEQQAAAEPAPQAPAKRSFAHKYMGL